ncbi:MAG: AAA family ATPase [bacterium]
MKIVEVLAGRLKIDLIVVDTACAGVDLGDENSNSEVARVVMKPFLKLVRRLNACLIMSHHIGKSKSEEGVTRDKVHSPRGASAFSGYPASVFVLDLDPYSIAGVILSCAKRKSGESYDRTLLLDRERRWFDLVGEVKREPSSYEQVLEAIRHLTGEPIKRAAINAELEGRLDERTITRRLEIAVKRGELLKVKKGQYSRKAANGQSDTPI